MVTDGSCQTQREIKVLRIIARMNVGGPAVQITSLMRFLPADRFIQRLLTGNCGSEEIDFLYEKDIQLGEIRVPDFGQNLNLLSNWKAFVEIRRTMQDFEPDIVHTHTAKAGFLGRIASLSIRGKHIRVHTFHGHLLHGYFGKAKKKFLIYLERFLARKTNALVAVGQRVKQDLIVAGIGHINQYHVISPGLTIDQVPSRKDAMNELGIALDGFVVGWIGRVVPIKALHRVIEIARVLQNLDSKICFLIAGDGPELSNLKKCAIAEELPITFLGWQTKIESVLGVCDLLMSTSINEGTPVSLIQAQMAGKPVLATNVGSSSEVLLHQQTGFCLDYSKDVFANIIKEMSVNPNLCRELGMKAKNFALQNFATKRLIEDHENLYLKLVNPANS